MEEWLIGLGALALAIACGALAKKWKFAKPLIAGVTLVCGLVMFFGLLVIMWPDFRRLFSYPVQFWGSVGVRHGLLIAGELAGGWILCEGLRRKRKFYLVIAPIFIMGVAVAYHRVSPHDYSGLSDSTDSRQFTFQSRGFTCSAASVSNVTGLFGPKISERGAAELMRLDNFGGSVWQVGYALHCLGYSFEETRDQSIAQVKFPALLILELTDSVEHAIVVTGRSGNNYEVLDPMAGKVTRDAAYFQSRWRDKGVMNIHR